MFTKKSGELLHMRSFNKFSPADKEMKYYVTTRNIQLIDISKSLSNLKISVRLI